MQINSQREEISAGALILLLKLERHPEGGWYRQIFQDIAPGDERAKSTAIYYLLEGGDRSHWHRVDAAEIWHFYAGSPLELGLSPDGKGKITQTLGIDFATGQRPQIIVPTGQWQSAKSLGEWTLCGCTVAPGFEFNGFEMAKPDWEPKSKA